MMFDLIIKQLSSPSTSKMMAGKLKELFSFLATEFKCEISDIGLFLKLEQVPAKDKAGKEIPGQTEAGAIIYVYVKGAAVQKIGIAEFLALATSGKKAK
jgi:hypothetical protein